MSQLAFRDGVMDRIRVREPRFHEHAFLFMLSALEFAQTRQTERRHLSGGELAEACRELALQRYGVLSRLVLEHWGVTTTSHFGDIVFALVDLGLLLAQPTDSRDDFTAVFDFGTAFDRNYPWNVSAVG
ncbi:MAG TPA: Minf_1886 family protein [Gemmatimonadaceae bacterium]